MERKCVDDCKAGMENLQKIWMEVGQHIYSQANNGADGQTDFVNDLNDGDLIYTIETYKDDITEHDIRNKYNFALIVTSKLSLSVKLFWPCKVIVYVPALIISSVSLLLGSLIVIIV